jgi:phosphate transport system substrate-binding protein
MLNKYNKYILMIIIPLLFMTQGMTVARAGVVIHAAGATFPYPIYAWWALRHGRLSGSKLVYNATGSGGGIQRIEQKTVDFGATDAPLSQSELDQYGLIQFPTVLGGVVPVIHIPGIKTAELMLTGSTLADIFLGKITRWNDDQLVQLNPNLHLPNLPISIVHRSKGSGTTWIFTNYLSKVSSSWRNQLGVNKSIDWPVGHSAIGNDGVIQKVQQTAGAIGYAEYAYVTQSHSAYALLRNHDGHFVKPSAKNFKAAAEYVDWSKKGADIVLTDKPGVKTWPIVGATFILMYKIQQKPEVAKAILSFFDWCYKEGDFFAEGIDYIPLSDNVKKNVRTTWHQQIHDIRGNPIWP